MVECVKFSSSEKLRVFPVTRRETNSHFRGLGKRFLHEPENGVTGNGWCNAEEILFVKKNEVFFSECSFCWRGVKKVWGGKDEVFTQ